MDPMSLHRKPKTQQAFLLEAMQRMGMDADQFARRLGASRRRLDDWLRAPGESGYVELDPVIWTFVREILERLDERDTVRDALLPNDPPTAALSAPIHAATPIVPTTTWLT
ncbi:hypothetical protein HZU84_06950 [Sphaerotilus natans subsp. sulfidivorans]|nr:hypothetical protein [Sphaerotilus sulfidivorans]